MLKSVYGVGLEHHEALLSFLQCQLKKISFGDQGFENRAAGPDVDFIGTFSGWVKIS